MKLDSKTIVGLPVKIARALLRQLNVSRINVETVLTFLNEEHWRSTVDAAHKTNARIPKMLRQRSDPEDRKKYCKIWGFKFRPIKLAEAERVFAALLDEGYLEPNNSKETEDDKAKYMTSQRGRQLAAANLTKRFDRAKADKEVADLIARADEINARDELVVFVRKITAFGSYLNGSNDLGDIDLVVETAKRREESSKESEYRADNSGKTLDFLASMYYGEREVMQFLKARKPRLSFNRSTTLELDTEFRVIYEWQPDSERRAEMKSFDWRLHEPLRQVKEWLTSNPGINSDPAEIARWCQDVAALLEHKDWQYRLFSDWSDNIAHRMLPYWGTTPLEAATLFAHNELFRDFCKRVSWWITEKYEKPIDAVIEAEIYSHFARDTYEIDAASLIGEHFGWETPQDC